MAEQEPINTRTILVQAVRNHGYVILMGMMILSSWIFISSVCFFVFKVGLLDDKYSQASIEARFVQSKIAYYRRELEKAGLKLLPEEELKNKFIEENK